MELMNINEKIVEIRGKKVILDKDLAVLYGVKTGCSKKYTTLSRRFYV